MEITSFPNQKKWWTKWKSHPKYWIVCHLNSRRAYFIQIIIQIGIVIVIVNHLKICLCYRFCWFELIFHLINDLLMVQVNNCIRSIQFQLHAPYYLYLYVYLYMYWMDNIIIQDENTFSKCSPHSSEKITWHTHSNIYKSFCPESINTMNDYRFCFYWKFQCWKCQKFINEKTLGDGKSH